jgi:hypothetical protein
LGFELAIFGMLAHLFDRSTKSQVDLMVMIVTIVVMVMVMIVTIVVMVMVMSVTIVVMVMVKTVGYTVTKVSCV